MCNTEVLMFSSHMPVDHHAHPQGCMDSPLETPALEHCNQELVSDYWLEMQRAEDAKPFPRHSSWLPATGELMILGHMGCLSTSSSQAGETWEKRINGTSTTKLWDVQGLAWETPLLYAPGKLYLCQPAVSPGFLFPWSCISLDKPI